MNTKDKKVKPVFHLKGVSARDRILPKDKTKQYFSPIELYNIHAGLCPEEKWNKIEDDFVGFFQQFWNDEEIYVLSSGIGRETGNNKRNVGFNDTDRMNQDCYTLKARVAVKHLKFKREVKKDTRGTSSSTTKREVNKRKGSFLPSHVYKKTNHKEQH